MKEYMRRKPNGARGIRVTSAVPFLSMIIDNNVLPWRSIVKPPGRYSENSDQHDLHSSDTGDNYTYARLLP